MSVPWYHYKATYVGQPIPAWSNTWPGYDGCSPRVLTLTQTNISAPPAPGSVGYYNPSGVVVSYGGKPAKGNSGINPRGRPRYRFTNYATGRIVRKEHLAITKWGTSGVNVFYQYGEVPKVGGACTPQELRRECTGPQYSTYDEQTRDYSSYNVYVQSDINEGDIATQRINLQNELLEEASTAYDLLTDISQLKDIPRTITQISGDLTKLLLSLKSQFGRNVMRRARSISPKKLLKHYDKQLRRFGGEWMNYRYGIMPLVYSLQDIMKIMDQGEAVRTRKRRIINPYDTGQTLPDSGATYRVKTVTGQAIVRGEVFQYFTSAEKARLARVGMNPLVTAWELIPYSFVFDWFVNVGSYIAAATCQNWAQKKYACLSIKRDYTIKTWVHLPKRDKTCSISNKLPNQWWGAAPPATPSVVIPNPEGLQLLDEEIVKTYTRQVFTTFNDALTFSPSLNWRRLVDGAVMSLNQLGRLVRHL